MKKFIAVSLITTLALALSAADIYVDYNKGGRKNPGTKAAPLDCFDRALKKAAPGDTIYILPSDKPIRDAIVFRFKSGEPGKPITVDAMNNIFVGSEPLNLKTWKEIKPGYFLKNIEMPKSMANRYFMIKNGKAHRMGRFNKAPCNVPYKSKDALLPGEWTLSQGKQSARNPKICSYEFLLRLPEGDKVPADSGFEEPMLKRVSGVNIAKDCNHLVIKNIIVKHFFNDGYNFHGNCRDLVLENLAAVECGDDAISAHETCEIKVKNFVAIACSTAICHINKSENYHENVYAEKILGRDIFLTESTKNVIKNGWFKADSIGGFRLTCREDPKNTTTIENVVMVNNNAKAPFTVDNGVTINFNNFKIANYKRIDKKLAAKCTKADTAEMEAEIAAARKRMFAIFGGQLEKAIGE